MRASATYDINVTMNLQLISKTAECLELLKNNRSVVEFLRWSFMVYFIGLVKGNLIMSTFYMFLVSFPPGNCKLFASCSKLQGELAKIPISNLQISQPC